MSAGQMVAQTLALENVRLKARVAELEARPADRAPASNATMSASDACYALILMAEQDGIAKYRLMATALHERIRGLEGRLLDEIATNNARIEDEDAQKFCKRLVRDNEALRLQLHDEIDANTAFREAGGALPDEDMPTFCARLLRERNELSAVVADIRNGTLVAKQECA